MLMKKDPCKPSACSIQKCLKENNYQEASCQQFIELLKECCRKWGSASISCSGIDTQETPSQTETAPVRCISSKCEGKKQ
ncbi:cx9C motif-containing protein 4 [Zootermopsis nevadensis]|uniref:cx9C motif-containing protein 4 n=1 Tax=Zootermopsis nevadensis TaxID=136037 RepID=UPI000B8E75F1|nr:cx9C motif-containing protein 4 [Zootermopsis nevadensis]